MTSRSPLSTAHPNGHFYSPVVDPAELAAYSGRLWPTHSAVLGIDFYGARHAEILREWFPRYIGDYDYPEKSEGSETPAQFYSQNSQFSWLDARAYFVLLRQWRPARIIEVGSGFSTLLAADVNRRFCNGAIEITCIDPYPRALLERGIEGVSRLIKTKVQEVDLAEFARLRAGDVLFIDSSHVAKTGSDVNFLYFEVLPHLPAGVHVHIHDVFLPREYPREWVLDDNRSWNEQYLVRALLMYSTQFAVEFGTSYAFQRYPELVRDALALPSGSAYGGGSLWIRTLHDGAVTSPA